MPQSRPRLSAANDGLTRPEAVHLVLTRTVMVSYHGVGVYEVYILIQIPRGT